MQVKLEWLGYRIWWKKLWPYVKPFTSDTGALRRDGQTDDGRTDRIAISLSHVSVLTRDKNQSQHLLPRQSAAFAVLNNWQAWICSGKSSPMVPTSSSSSHSTSDAIIAVSCLDLSSCCDSDWNVTELYFHLFLAVNSYIFHWTETTIYKHCMFCLK